MYSSKKATFEVVKIDSSELQHEESKRETNFSAKIKIYKKGDSKFTKNDLIYYEDKPMKLTNSIVFYMNNYYNKEKFFIFPTKSVNNEPISIEEQNYQCYICLHRFEFILGLPIEKIFWCSYFMKYVCKNCIADEYCIIPAFVLSSWNFNKYSISKYGKTVIEKWQDKPVIHIKGKNHIIKLSGLLKQAITVKRKIHKIFDLMKCPEADAFVTKTLGTYMYIVFKENYFSLKDLCEVNDFTFISKLYEFFKAFETHILTDCSICQYKGSNCFICNKENVLRAYNIESTIYCYICNQIFHKKCATFHPCLIMKK